MALTRLTGNAPAGLSPFSREVFDLIAKYTMFPWPIMTAQCKRGNVDPMLLDRASLAKVLPFIVEGVGSFTSPAKAQQIQADLTRLAHPR